MWWSGLDTFFMKETKKGGMADVPLKKAGKKNREYERFEPVTLKLESKNKRIFFG